MTRREDLTGRKFGRLTVLGYSHTIKGKAYWLCECECGRMTIVESYHLKSGHTKSCGCLHRETGGAKEKCTIHGESGIHKTRLYRIWKGVNSRCNNPKTSNFKNYGGRGITICDEWRHYPAFKSWALANGYADKLTIDRIDNDKGYCPENCRWVDHVTQHNNTRTNHLITHNGEIHTIAEWARITNIPKGTLVDRLTRKDRKQWTVEEALTTPPKRTK